MSVRNELIQDFYKWSV